MKEKAVYLPGLNGIRALAALAVVLSHTTLKLAEFGLNPYVFGSALDGKPKSLDLAGFGVSMFFALSGFLITYLLCLEKEKASINVRKFYARRILRIWPLYYAYFLLCLLVYALFQIEYNGQSIWYYLFYMANVPFVLGTTLPFLNHFWSLGVEEQFYAFWPWINRLKTAQIVRVSLLLIFLLFGLKVVLHLFLPGTTLELFIHVTRVHCMMFGALGALALYSNYQPLLVIATHRVTQLFCWVIYAIVALNQFHIATFIDDELIAGVTVLIILGQVTKTSPVNLENRLFDFLGKISYGMYVIHPLLIFLFYTVLKGYMTDHVGSYAMVYLLVLGTTILLSYLSYRYFESWFLRIKHKRFTVISSRSSRY